MWACATPLLIIAIVYGNICVTQNSHAPGRDTHRKFCGCHRVLKGIGLRRELALGADAELDRADRYFTHDRRVPPWSL
jgi:hypothetical protein